MKDYIKSNDKSWSQGVAQPPTPKDYLLECYICRRTFLQDHKSYICPNCINKMRPRRNRLRSAEQGYIPKPPITPEQFKPTNNCGSYHNLDCQSNLAASVFDTNCARCKKIKQVILLRRKTTLNGCSIEEFRSAIVIANKIEADYKLTRGEVFDREYPDEVASTAIARARAAQYKRAKKDPFEFFNE